MHSDIVSGTYQDFLVDQTYCDGSFHPINTKPQDLVYCWNPGLENQEWYTKEVLI